MLILCGAGWWRIWTAPRKQRHTARRIWQRLIEEEGARVGESTVRNLVARLRVEISGDRCQVMVPQTHPPAAEAEVDFGEFTASIAGQVMKLFMFCMRLSYSGKAFHFAYANQTQESFLDGHVRAFQAFGGVPTGMVRYDNLKPAVIRVALGRERFEHPRFVALRSHYGYDSFFCAPGLDGAHEKGGVEGEIGRFRRRHLTPIPHVGSLAALNAALAAADARDDARRIGARLETVGGAAAQELPLLRPLPVEPFDVALALSCRVDAKARVCVRQSYYSVPARYAGRRLEVRLGATMVTVVDGGTRGRLAYPLVAQRQRGPHAGPLPGGADPQTWRVGRVDRAGRRPGLAARSPLIINGSGIPPAAARRRRRHPRPGRGAAAAPHPARRRGDRRHDRRGQAGQLRPRPGRGRGPTRQPSPTVAAAQHANRPRPTATGRRRSLAGYDQLLAGGVGMTAAVTRLAEPAADAAIVAAAKTLQLPTIRAQAGPLAAAAAKQRLSHKAFLAEVLTAECDERDARRRVRLVHEAKFPRTKRLADFDHTRIPDLTPALLGTPRRRRLDRRRRTLGAAR